MKEKRNQTIIKLVVLTLFPIILLADEPNKNPLLEALSMGMQEFEKGNNAEAIKIMSLVLEVPDLNSIVQCQAYKFRGLAYSEKSKYRKALRDLMIAKDLCQHENKEMYSFILSGICLSYYNIKEQDAGFDFCNQAIVFNPKNYVALRIRSGIHALRNEFLPAIKDISTAINVAPTALNFRLRSILRLALSDIEGAQSDLAIAKEKALEEGNIQLYIEFLNDLKRIAARKIKAP